jgi:NADPH:quinone reductase-like Zn-dependent oxidoreductase
MDFIAMNKLIDATEMSFEGLIDKTFPFEKAAEALEYLWSGKHVGKVVVGMP